MAGTTTKVRVIPAWVAYDGADLGYTKGGAIVNRQFIAVPIVIQGAPTDIVCIRKEITVDVNLAETSYNRLQILLNLDLDRGDDLLDYTATLTLTAIDNASDVTTIPNAYCVGNTNVPFMLDKERVWPVQFKAIYTVGDFYFAEIS